MKIWPVTGRQTCVECKIYRPSTSTRIFYQIVFSGESITLCPVCVVRLKNNLVNINPDAKPKKLRRK